MKYSYKNIISIVFVTVLCALISVVAYATDPLTAGLGWAGLAGSGVTIGGMAGLTAGQVNSIYNAQTGSQIDSYLNDPNNIGEFMTFGSYHETIDNVEYSDIWISHDFASYIQSEGFGYIIDKSINSESFGTLAEGVGFRAGIPIFNVNGERRSQAFIFSQNGTYQFGDAVIEIKSFSKGNSSTTYNYIVHYGETFPTGSVRITTGAKPNGAFGVTPSYEAFGFVSGNWLTNPDTRNIFPYINKSFTFDYISSVIDTEPISSEEGLRIFIPSSYLPEPSGQYFIDGAGNDDINILSTAITQAVADGVAKSIVYEPEDRSEPIPPPPIPVPTPVPTPEPVPSFEPVPTPEPLPTTPIDEVTLQDIENAIINGGAGTDNIILDESHDIQERIASTGAYIGALLEAIRELIRQGLISLLDAIELIRAKVSELVDILEAVLEAVLTHPLDLFGATLDGIGNFFGGAFGELKRHLGIWHYVVEWIASISGVFAWIFAICNSTSYYIVLPIYALVAAAICLALYKRFGR